MKELKDMTLQELKEQKAIWYEENTRNGNIQKLITIARQVGEKLSHNYGPKYNFTNGVIEIYVDDYGNYMTTKVNGKLKVSTHNDKLYVPGEWEEIIARLYPEAQELYNQTKSESYQYEYQKLLNELT